MNDRDVWPKTFVKDSRNSPGAIFSEHASDLAAITNDIVTAEVVSKRVNEGRFYYKFYLVAPALDNYQFSLFDFSYGFDYYPVRFANLDRDLQMELGLVNKPIAAEDKKELLILLIEISHSKRVVQIINTLLAESEGR